MFRKKSRLKRKYKWNKKLTLPSTLPRHHHLFYMFYTPTLPSLPTNKNITLKRVQKEKSSKKYKLNKEAYLLRERPLVNTNWERLIKRAKKFFWNRNIWEIEFILYCFQCNTAWCRILLLCINFLYKSRVI